MSSLSNRVVNLEAEAERRWEQSIAERLAVIDGTSVAEWLVWLAETRPERAAVVRSCSGRSVAVSEIVRQMAAEAGLDAAETAAAIREAEASAAPTTGSVMSFRDRLRRLEGGLPAPRCAHCVGWGPRVVVVNDPELAESEPTPVPARCPRCGREPLTVIVEYVESWPPDAVA